MTNATKQQIRQFAHGRLDDHELVLQLEADIEQNPDGRVATYLRFLEELGRRFVDPNDTLFLQLLSHEDTNNDSELPTTRDLIVLDSPVSNDIIKRPTTLPARAWQGIVTHPRQTFAVAACISLIAFGGYRVGVTSTDDVAERVKSVQGQVLVTAIEDDGVFVACDRNQPLEFRFDVDGKVRAWQRVEPNEAGTEIGNGLRISWPRGRPGCVITVSGVAQGILYIMQSTPGAEGVAFVPIPPESNGNRQVALPALLESPFDADDVTKARSQWAEHLHVDESIENSIGMNFQLIPPGSFLMGSNQHESNHQDDEFEHQVRLTKPFYASVYETRQSDFVQIMGYNPSHFQSDDEDTSQHPVESLTWFEMVEFANRLSESESLTPCYVVNDAERKDGRLIKATVELSDGNGYRLPTEAEWEYQCRSGTTGRWYSGPTPSRELISKIAHIKGEDTPRHPISVGSLAPNTFGLHDTIGNVWEWVQDWHDESYFSMSPVRNPPGPTAGRYKVIRGGSWNEPPLNARVPNRGKLTPYTKDKDRGFRLVRSAR